LIKKYYAECPNANQHSLEGGVEQLSMNELFIPERLFRVKNVVFSPKIEPVLTITIFGYIVQ
jgi:hypothetical protein